MRVSTAIYENSLSDRCIWINDCVEFYALLRIDILARRYFACVGWGRMYSLKDHIMMGRMQDDLRHVARFVGRPGAP